MSMPRVQVLSGAHRRERFVTSICRGEFSAYSSCVLIYMSTSKVQVLWDVERREQFVTLVSSSKSIGMR